MATGGNDVTETEWNSCTDPNSMLEFIQNRASERKLRLFGAACCRRVWRLMTDPRHRRAVEAAERLADGLITEEQFKEIHHPVMAMWAKLPSWQDVKWEPSHYMTGAATHLGTGAGAEYAASFAARGLAYATDPDHGPGWLAVQADEERVQCGIIRDLFGNPNVPFRFEADWLAGDGRYAAARAGEIYRDGDFDFLSLLADELERAGCRDSTVLDHCRRLEPHTRGCWVIDALMGRESAVRTGLMTAADWQSCYYPQPLLHFLHEKESNRKWRLFAVACCRRIDHLITDQRSRRAVEVAALYADDASREKELEAARAAAQEALMEAKRAEHSAEAEANFCTTPAYAAACLALMAADAARASVCRDPRQSDAEPGGYEAKYWRPSHASAAAAVHNSVLADFEGARGDSGWEECEYAAESAWTAELEVQCCLLRDIFGAHLGPPGNNGKWLPCGPHTGHPIYRYEQWCQLPTPRVLVLPPECLTWNDGAVGKLACSIYDNEAFHRLPLLADLLAETGCADAAILAHCREPGSHVRGCWVVDLLIGRE
jgi:hypothetical protein